jgi:isocitrate/isopropylmalate dehydrogenase
MLNAAVDMLEHLGHHYHANMIHKAIDRTINEDHIHTPGIMFLWSLVKVTFL